jgi:uncharacterized protein YxjI
MRQKLFSWGDDFVIKDDKGRERYKVDGAVFALRDSLTFLTPDGKPVAAVTQKLLSWGPTYEIERGGRVVAVVKKSLFTLLSCRFSVDVPGPDDLEATGDFLEHEYRIVHTDERPAAVVTKRFFDFTDTYGVEVEPGEDDVLILATTVVIDLCCHQSGD